MSKYKDKISKKKPLFPIGNELEAYLKEYNRFGQYGINYEDLDHYIESFPIYDHLQQDTLWQGLIYSQSDFAELEKQMINLYVILNADGDFSINLHLKLDRIDFCSFGNTKPFRIKIINRLNDNHDYFYIKKNDASRVYGLELEHILSPNRINYLISQNTIIEEHIAGIPGDQFSKDKLTLKSTNQVRVAKEFIKFNERCFVRLLGDMRSYNYVIDITPDFDNEQYRIRAIDFDQQSYEGKKSLYLPQFLKENNGFVQLCIETLGPENVKQYQQEERALMKRRALASNVRLRKLLDCLVNDSISARSKIDQLKQQLAAMHNEKKFLECSSMGEIVQLHLSVLLKITL